MGEWNPDAYLNSLGIKPTTPGGTAVAEPPAAKAQQGLSEIPKNLADQGFAYVPGTDLAVSPSYNHGSAKTPAYGGSAYLNPTTGQWTVRPASPGELQMAGGAKTPAPTGAPAPTAQPPAAAPAVPAPSNSLPSPAAQTNSATKSMLTPGSKDTQSITVPFNYEKGPSGYQSTDSPFGGKTSIYVPHEIQFSAANLNGGAPAPAPVPTNPALTPASIPGPKINATGGVGDKAYGPPTPAPTPTTGQDGGTVPGKPAAGDIRAGLEPIPSDKASMPQPNLREPIPDAVPGQVPQRENLGSLAPDRQAFIDQMYATAAAWSAKTGIPPEVYLAINGSESNFGKANSYFGVKGEGNAGSNNYDTHEVVGGKNVPQNDQFAKYSDANAAYQGFHDFLSNNERYAPALAQYQQDKDSGALLQNINKAGYATDPNWANMIQGMASDIRPNLPNAVTGEAGSGFTPQPETTKTPATPPVGPDGKSADDWTATMQAKGMLPGGGTSVSAKGTLPASTPVGPLGPTLGNIMNGGTRPSSNTPDMWGRMVNGANSIASEAPPSFTPVPAASPLSSGSTSIYASGPQTYHLGSMSEGYNPKEVLRGNGIPSSGDADTDAVLAARIIQQQAPGGGLADPLADRNPGATGTFQSPKSGGLENETRTDRGYVFSPGNINQEVSVRSPMGAYTPVMTPEGVVIRSANQPDQSPASQGVAYQNAGFGVKDSAGNPLLVNPTSNLGAVTQAAQATAANGGQRPDFASAANLPSATQLTTLGTANAAPAPVAAPVTPAAASPFDKAAADIGAGVDRGAADVPHFDDGGSIVPSGPVSVVSQATGQTIATGAEGAPGSPEAISFTPLGGPSPLGNGGAPVAPNTLMPGPGGGNPVPSSGMMQRPQWQETGVHGTTGGGPSLAGPGRGGGMTNAMYLRTLAGSVSNKVKMSLPAA